MLVRNEIKTISYLSNSSKLKGEEIEELLIDTRDNNNRLGIGGVLIYANGTFFQVIEGDAHQIELLFAKIEADQRHFNVLKLLEVIVPSKKFDRFNFKYINNDDQVVRNIMIDLLENNNDFDEETHSRLIEKAQFLLDENK